MTKRGRPFLSDKEATVLVSVKVPLSVRCGIERLGEGSVSEGLRKLWKQWLKVEEKWRADARAKKRRALLRAVKENR